MNSVFATAKCRQPPLTEVLRLASKNQPQSVMLYNRTKKVNRNNAKNTDTFLKGVGASRFSFARCRLHYRIGNLSLSNSNGKHGRHLLPSLTGARRRSHDPVWTLLRREL